jgi:hypothetical protein
MEEPLWKVILMIDFFQKLKKRLPRHIREVKDFIEGLGYPLELSEFQKLTLEPLSDNRLVIEFSLFTGEDKWTPCQKVEARYFLDELTEESEFFSGLNLESFSSKESEKFQYS